MPFRVGEFGGALYLFMVVGFAFILAIPVLLTEYAVGRGSGKSIAQHYQVLQPEGTKWHWASYMCMAGNYLLLMFYVMICGFALGYLIKAMTGELIGQPGEVITASWRALTGSGGQSFSLMAAIVVGCILTCYFGLNKGIAQVGKYMMGGFFILLII